MILCFLATVLAEGCIERRIDQTERANVKGPRIILWVWDRAEDLSYLSPTEYGFAYLAETIHLEDQGIFRVEHRHSGFHVPESSWLGVVIRIESAWKQPWSNYSHIQQVAREIVRAALVDTLGRMIQIDFDAKLSEHAFYVQLIREVHFQLRGNRKLSVTALASWCNEEWLNELEVDEVVPMMFQLGKEGEQLKRAYYNSKGFSNELCNSCIGLSTEEQLVSVDSRQTVYIFSPQPWSAEILSSYTLGKRDQ